MTKKSQGRQGIIIHEGPMADRRGTQWREDAAGLEAMDQRRMDNPMQSLPNKLTTIDKDHAYHAKSDEGTVDQTAEPFVEEETQA